MRCVIIPLGHRQQIQVQTFYYLLLIKGYSVRSGCGEDLHLESSSSSSAPVSIGSIRLGLDQQLAAGQVFTFNNDSTVWDVFIVCFSQQHLPAAPHTSGSAAL